MAAPMDDIVMKPPGARARGMTASRCGGRSPAACSRISAPASIRPAAGCRPKRNCRSSSGSIATPCAARWRNCRAAAWCGWSRAAARSSPRTCWNTRSRRARDFPNGSGGTTRNHPGRCCSSRRPRPSRMLPRALGIRPGSRVVLLERLGFADDRPVSLAQHYFPAARLRGLARRAARLAQHHRSAEGGRRVGLPAPGHPRHRAPAERARRRNCCACRATGRCW